MCRLLISRCLRPKWNGFAEVISGSQRGDAQLERPVRLVAEAQIDMHRVRQARHRFLADKLSQKDYQKLSTVRLKKRASCAETC